MRLLLLLALVGCDEAFDLVEVPAPDASQLPMDLIAHWPLDALANNRAADVAGGRDATCGSTECPTMAAGTIDGALHFDGQVQALHGQDPAFETTSGFTVSAWVNLETVPANFQFGCMLSKLYGPDAANSWQFCVQGPMLTAWFVDASGLDHNITGPDLPAGEWHNVAVAWDGTLISLWLDAVLVRAEPSNGVGFDGSEILIGADQDFGARFGAFLGAIDDVRIYDRALTLDELRGLANPGR